MITRTYRDFRQNLEKIFWLDTLRAIIIRLIIPSIILMIIMYILYIVISWITPSGSFGLSLKSAVSVAIGLFAIFIIFIFQKAVGEEIRFILNDIKIFNNFKNIIENHDKILEKSNDDKAWFSKGLRLFNYDSELHGMRSIKKPDGEPFFREAAECFKNAAAIKKGREALYYWAESLIELGILSRAVEILDDARFSTCVFSVAPNLFSGAAFDLPKYNTLYFINSNHSEQTRLILVNQAYILKKLRRYEEALRDYDILLKEYTAYDYNLDRGICLLNMGMYEKALQCFEAIEIYSLNNIDVYKFRGMAYNKLGKYEEAIDNFNRALYLRNGAGKRDGEIWYNRGLALQALNRKKDARISFWKARRLNYRPEYSWWHFW